MTMGEDSIVASLMMPVLIRPILQNLEKKDAVAAQTLRAAFSKMEGTNPGFCHSMILALLGKADVQVNMCESLLRLQGQAVDHDSPEYRCSRSEEVFQELNKKSFALKKILSRIPDEIADRRAFLETIKEIASAIKKLLDAVNEVSNFIPGAAGKQVLEQRKRDFVKYSKRFSTTLKEYFRDTQANAVFLSALYLINQANLIMVTVKDRCE